MKAICAWCKKVLVPCERCRGAGTVEGQPCPDCTPGHPCCKLVSHGICKECALKE